MSKILPRDLTSYDLLKSLALILMITDHVGHFFYPDEMWFRIFGRLCVPMWFFLIGYARTTELPKTLWGGAVVVALSAFVTGQYLLPVNILFTIIIIRMLRGRLILAAFSSAESLRGLFFLLFFATFPTALFFEYGAMGMMFALFGFAVRNIDGVCERMERKHVKIYAAATFFAFYMWQGVIMPHVSDLQALVFGAGLVLVGVMLWRFQGVVYTGADRLMARSFVKLFQFMGRRTLEIYVFHVVLFRLICVYLYPEDYVFMKFQLVPEGAFSIFM
jgi:hypothetical protein